MMLRELLTLFRSGEPLKAMGDDFAEMLRLTLELVKKSGEAFFARTVSEEERTQIQRQDIQVNKLQRRIRKQVVVHLSVAGNSADLPYCLVLMSLVKDVERIGDYAKDLVNLVNLGSGPLVDDELARQLAAIRPRVEADFEAACDVFAQGDRERAVCLIRRGRELVEHCEELKNSIARSSHPAALVAKLVLATRFYERIEGHVLNLLSSVVMPLHKLDYYDEKDIERAGALE
jgi:phosphate transport system protein